MQQFNMERWMCRGLVRRCTDYNDMIIEVALKDVEDTGQTGFPLRFYPLMKIQFAKGGNH